jgi:mRNA interferase RelE/StbE
MEPRPAGCERLTGEDLYRIRQGDYRVIYSLADAELTVLVIHIGHRRDVYR